MSAFFFRRDYRKIYPPNFAFEDFLPEWIDKTPVWDQFSWFQGRLDDFDFIGRFETLEKDFQYICKEIGAADKELPHVYKTNHVHYSHYYDDAMVDMVADYAKKDIDIFGYSFERV